MYKVKYKAHGKMERYKTRLVAKAYSQKEGMDYSYTFSPIAKIVTMRSLIAIITSKNWFIYQMNIHNDFLNGDLLEKVEMCIP